MFAKPQTEHNFLAPLVGSWTSESECQMGPDQPPMKSSGTIKSRMLGGLWLICDMAGAAPDKTLVESVLTLGFNPEQGRYVGSFIASCMTFAWQYNGAVEAGTRRLVLDTQGPAMDGKGLANYQDIVEIISDDEWTLSSRIQMADGNWVPFMKAVHRRVS